jgi:hypothetical protein
MSYQNGLETSVNLPAAKRPATMGLQRTLPDTGAPWRADTPSKVTHATRYDNPPAAQSRAPSNPPAAHAD